MPIKLDCKHQSTAQHSAETYTSLTRSQARQLSQCCSDHVPRHMKYTATVNEQCYVYTANLCVLLACSNSSGRVGQQQQSSSQPTYHAETQQSQYPSLLQQQHQFQQLMSVQLIADPT
eukprot:6924-Heterococcus_DN1.PRE.9